MNDKPDISPENASAGPPYRRHPRHFRGSQLVYPVVSRRSGGLSVGVNLNPDQRCNFNCLYCQVHREHPADVKTVPFSLEILETELEQMLSQVVRGEIYQYDPFDQTPVELRRLNDIALSGDGEPTAVEHFAAACRLCARVKDDLKLGQVKLVLLTNASLLHRPDVQEGLQVLDRHQGEIWAKLDAGTPEYFRLVNQTKVSFAQILDNLLRTAQVRPLVIQSLFLRLDGARTPPGEVAAYVDQLAAIVAGGGRIALVQLHTIARPPRDRCVSSLSDAELDDIAREVRQGLNVPVRTYYA
jgi:wyosine [tRNA(Phe)-imidazoG37] synthetase (radical SAM superfamily)